MLVSVLLIVELTGLREQFSLTALRTLLEANLLVGVLLFVLAFAIGNLIQLPGWPFLAAAILAALSVIRHHANIRRILKGEEPRIGARKD